MGSKERIQRLKENTRSNILRAALKIVKQEGWQALSMRKIAGEIDYTAPLIYEYFSGKEAIIKQLSDTGFKLLTAQIREAKKAATTAVAQLEAMWLAYWQFAFAEKELYQAMFGVDVNCPDREDVAGSEAIAALFSDVIRQLMPAHTTTEEMICTKYYACWSAVHGLVSINLVHKGKSAEINQHVLHDAIQGMIASMTH